MRGMLLLGLGASIGLVLVPLPFVWIWLLWSGLFVRWAAVAERPAAKLACINAAGILLVFSVAEATLQLRPGLELSGSLTDGYFQGHESLGYAPLPENRATARRSFAGEVLYDVVYTIDQNGLRVAPPVAEGAGEECLLFFGGSFTFGEGVNDAEAMPYQVGVETHGRFRVYNFGFHGYGPHQALAALEDGLVAGVIDCAPRFAIYQALPDHVTRAAGFTPWDSHGPRYVLEPGGGVVYAGHFDDGSALYGRALRSALNASRLFAVLLSRRQPEQEAGERLFVGIVDAVRQHLETRYPGCEFHVILWDDPHSSLSRRLAGAGLRLHPIDAIVPAEELGQPRYTLPRDGHPTARLHERVAAYVARVIVGDSAPPAAQPLAASASMMRQPRWPQMGWGSSASVSASRHASATGVVPRRQLSSSTRRTVAGTLPSQLSSRCRSRSGSASRRPYCSLAQQTMPMRLATKSGT